jgi:hypothetical protein
MFTGLLHFGFCSFIFRSAFFNGVVFRTQFIMSGWEPTEIRQQQLSDESIGCIMAAIETGKDRPAWECFQWNIATTNLVEPTKGKSKLIII